MPDETFEDLQHDLVRLLPRLRRFARGLTGTADQADDLVQEACEKALQKSDKWRPGTALDSWMYKIIQNCWRDQLGAGHRRFVSSEPLDPAWHATDGAAATESHLALRAVGAALQRLEENQRTVLLLICVEGLSYSDAAKTLGWPMGTVMSRLARARLALHTLVEGEFLGEKARTAVNTGRPVHA